MEEPMEFTKFVAFASDHGVKNVTQNEYDTLVAGTTFSAAIQLRRVRNSRSKSKKQMDHEPMVAFSLGGRDNRFDEKTQWVSFLKADGTLEDYKHRGKWTGKHGRRHKIDIEVTEGISKKTGNPWIAKDIKAVTVLEDKVRSDRIKWRMPDELRSVMSEALDTCRADNDGSCPHKDEKHYPTVAVIGEISEVRGERVFDNGIPTDDTIPANQNETYPTCTLILKGENVWASCHFGPWNTHGVPYLSNMDGFDSHESPTLDDLDMNFSGMTVGVIANFTKLSKTILDSGEDYFYAHLSATAIFNLDEHPLAKPAESATVPVTGAQSDTESSGAGSSVKTPGPPPAAHEPPNPAVAAQVTALKNLIRTQLSDAPSMEVADFLKLEEVQKLFPSSSVEQQTTVVSLALSKVQGETATPAKEGGTGDTTIKVLKAKILDLVRERSWVDPDDLRRNFWDKSYAGRNVTALDIGAAVEQLTDEERITESSGGIELV